MKRSTVLIADDHAVVAEGLRYILDRAGFAVVGVVRDGWDLFRAAGRLRPDVIVTDIAMPSLNGIEAARKIREQNAKSKIIFLTMHPELVYAKAAITAGASGYVLKSAAGEELVSAIRHALKGRTYISKQIAQLMEHAGEVRPGKNRGAGDELTRRQREVLELLAKGFQVKEIAATLNISSKTVEFHKYRIMDVLGMRTVANLTHYAVKNGIVE